MKLPSRHKTINKVTGENGIQYRDQIFFSRGKILQLSATGRKCWKYLGHPVHIPRRDGTRALGATGEINKRLDARQRRRSASLRDADACAATLRGRRAPRRKTGRRDPLEMRETRDAFDALDFRLLVAREFPLKKRSILNLGKYFQRRERSPRQLLRLRAEICIKIMNSSRH